MARRTLTESVKENRDRLAAMSAVAGDFKTWRPQAEVLVEVEAVPTIFPWYDRALGVGGHPTARITVVHGPSNEGKSTLALGLGRSFLARDHFFGYVDAERTTPQPYVRTMMGALADHPGFSALPVGSYEKTRASVREYCETIAAARSKGSLPADTTALVVVDSLRKLVPENLWKELGKAIKADVEDAPKRATKFGASKKPKGVDGAGGRAGQIKAAMNSAWVDELVPLMADCRVSMLLIARETTEDGEGFFADDVVNVGGGVAVVYDASLRLRCQRSFIYEDLGGKSKEMVGERISVDVMKTKIHQKDTAVPRSFFHVSNGRLCPEGFDVARNVFELAQHLDVIEIAGSYYKFQGKTIAQGAGAALAALHADTGLTMEIESACRAAE